MSSNFFADRTLGATDILAADVTLGTSLLGLDTVAGDTSEDAAVATALALLTQRSALVDSSNNYGGGRSEAVLGTALATLSGDERVDAAARIVTKVDSDPHTGAFDRDRVRRSFEESLERLGVDHVRILHLHDPYSVAFEQAAAAGGAIEGMRELRDEGLVDAIGIAAGSIPLVTRYVDTGAFDVVLTHNRYTLVDQSAAPLWRNARQRGMGIFNAAPFGGGLLASGAQEGATYNYRAAPAELVDWVSRVERLCVDHGIDLPAAALQFSLHSPLVDSTVVRVSSPQRLEELHAMRTVDIPAVFWDDLESLGAAPSPIVDGMDSN